MFGLFGPQISPVRRRLAAIAGVRRTWIEWTIDDGIRAPTLVVECICEMDPAAPDFDRNDFVEIMAAVNAIEPGEVAPARVRVVPPISNA